MLFMEVCRFSESNAIDCRPQSPHRVPVARCPVLRGCNWNCTLDVPSSEFCKLILYKKNWKSTNFYSFYKYASAVYSSKWGEVRQTRRAIRGKSVNTYHSSGATAPISNTHPIIVDVAITPAMHRTRKTYPSVSQDFLFHQLHGSEIKYNFVYCSNWKIGIPTVTLRLNTQTGSEPIHVIRPHCINCLFTGVAI